MGIVRLFGKHLTSIVGYLALAVALSGGAYAAVTAQDGPAPGQNSVGSLDVINGQVLNVDIGPAQVTGAKLAPNAVRSGQVADGSLTSADLKQPAWVNVPPNSAVDAVDPDPCSSGATAMFCGFWSQKWQNYGEGFQTARLYKDINNQVHIEGWSRPGASRRAESSCSRPAIVPPQDRFLQRRAQQAPATTSTGGSTSTPMGVCPGRTTTAATEPSTSPAPV